MTVFSRAAENSNLDNMTMVKDNGYSFGHKKFNSAY